ncbi:hypothetical protein Hte_001660 [Hypoxylon texense]
MMDIDTDYSARYAYTSDQIPRVLSPDLESSASIKRNTILGQDPPQVNRVIDDENSSTSVDSVDPVDPVDVEMTDSLEDGIEPVQYPSADIDMIDASTQDEAVASVPEKLKRRELPKTLRDPYDADLDFFDMPTPVTTTYANKPTTPSTFEAEVIGLCVDRNKIHSISIKDGRLKIRFQETAVFAAI